MLELLEGKEELTGRLSQVLEERLDELCRGCWIRRGWMR